MAENLLPLPENPIGLTLLDCLESGLDDLFETTTSDGRASEIVELVAVGYKENDSVLFEIDTNQKLKEDPSKNLVVNDVDISIMAETIPMRSHESICDKTKDFPVQYSSEPSLPPPHMEILEALERETDSMNTSEQSIPITNRVNEYEEDQLGKTTYSNKLNQSNVIEPTVVDVPLDNPSTIDPDGNGLSYIANLTYPNLSTYPNLT
ncbi:hypothetical protein GHT06_019035 [Daphnia sinensis]|uniref:Uncharacterized protein n=1 Tax=Daphnia sinensis TaxID=1820382 RepID=A0AAD5PN62_9CRUS|nr:hypothetical protein GHT06_019035 [Daphnia sinensis]